MRKLAQLIAVSLFVMGIGCAKEGGAKSRIVAMSVTEKGFEPDALTVKHGEPLTLVITRKTDKTCAREIIIDGHGVSTKLPLNEPVNVTFTPNKTGEVKYGCAMDKMIGGVLKIE